MGSPRLEKTKAKSFPDVEGEYGIEDVEEIFGQFMPKDAELPGKNKEDEKKSKKGDKDDDKKSKKDDKKDKKGDKDDDKKDKKGDKDKGKDDKKGKDSKDKKKKDAVKLNKAEELQVNNFIRNMVFGEGGKNKSIVT